MSYTLTLHCGCTVYVACHPQTRIAHTRVIQSRGGACIARAHAIGVRLYLWEMLPDPAHRPRPAWVDSTADTRRRA